jgi:hypothetical protein
MIAEYSIFVVIYSTIIAENSTKIVTYSKFVAVSSSSVTVGMNHRINSQELIILSGYVLELTQPLQGSMRSGVFSITRDRKSRAMWTQPFQGREL